ncbi:MAG TPA: Zn-ribbon domain-containing OB-fold protein [Dehalococcoidia bacterium]|nr:Zn-ribbon domain-containing OB-fold protein [Dehalococcoidia bacterium]
MPDELLAPLAELVPAETALNAPHLEGLAAGEVRLQHCTQCGAYQYPPESFCYHCPSTSLEWESVEGLGTVYSFIIVHQRYHAAFGDRVPYNVAIVEFDVGPRVLGNILEIDNDAVEIGMRVRPRIEQLGDGQAALFFEPASDA